MNKFIDVVRGKKNVFDILLDKDINGIPGDLRSVLKEYGAVVIKVESGVIDIDKVLWQDRHCMSRTLNSFCIGVLELSKAVNLFARK